MNSHRDRSFPFPKGMGSGVEGPAVSRTLQKSRNSYDFNVWSEMKFVEKLRYIHRNPVERGLAAKPEDWPWSSFGHYAAGEIRATASSGH